VEGRRGFEAEGRERRRVENSREEGWVVELCVDVRLSTRRDEGL
jgi:hypothetical protein